jgi:23S rRNA pseudouridine1911/1915/1917 synthase
MADRRRRFKLVVFLLFGLLASKCTGFITWRENFSKTFCKATAEYDDSMFETTHQWTVPAAGLSGDLFEERFKPHLTSHTNATLPLALMVLDSEMFPTRSKAMRAIRQQKVLVERRNLDRNHHHDQGPKVIGKADTRIYPLDVLIHRKRRRTKGYNNLSYEIPPVPLPVVFEDDYFAVVDKPSGMLCYSHSKGGFNDNSVLRVIPHVLRPPCKGIEGAFEFPALVHRLDADTSGLLVIAKTKPAAVHLSDQFASRQVQKIYIALLQGTLNETEGTISYPIDEKRAITQWRTIRDVRSTKGRMTLVEFRPLHGRKHQLRRHAAEALTCPIVGDALYGSTVGKKLMLCAKEISLTHPTHGTPVHAKIDLPSRFTDYMRREETRYAKYEQWMLDKGIKCLFEIGEVAESIKQKRATL